MRILHLCKMDAGGGAADGFMRIHSALVSQGIASTAYVMKRRRQATAVVSAPALLNPAQKGLWLARRLTAKVGRLGRKVEGVFDFDQEGVFPVAAIIAHARRLAPRWDAVLVHWSGGYVSPDAVLQVAEALGARVGLWQVDMAHMTGGCHYSLDCLRYRDGCGRCPALGSSKDNDISRLQAGRRAQVWRKAEALVLAQSVWSARKAAESYVLKGLRQKVLPIPLDLDILTATGDQAAARRRLRLPEDGRRMVLVRAVDPRITYKGFGTLGEAFTRLDRAGVRLHVLSAGPKGFLPPDLTNVTCSELGSLSGDEAMSAAYHACDFFACPSLDDAGPMMIPEALASGRPVLSTSVGIAPDLIIEGVNGSLCGPPGNSEALAKGLRHYAELPAEELLRQGAAAAQVRARLSRAVFAQKLAEAFAS